MQRASRKHSRRRHAKSATRIQAGFRGRQARVGSRERADRPDAAAAAAAAAPAPAPTVATAEEHRANTRATAVGRAAEQLGKLPGLDKLAQRVPSPPRQWRMICVIVVSLVAGILFGVLCLTGLLCVAGIVLDKGSTFKDVLRPGDGFLSARGQSAWYSIALSFFASGMGAWIVYGTTEMGATRPISWWGVIGYSTASAFPAVLLCWLGPRIKTVVGAASGFSATDFALSRYGRLMHLHVCCISCFYMYIYMVAELTSIGNVYATLVGKSVAGDDSENFTTKIAICVALFTWAYTALAGLPASILTDKFQGVTISIFVIMLLIAATTLKSNEVPARRPIFIKGV